MRKNYNFTRRKLYLPEYGRHIHEMVDSLLESEDRHERTRQAKAVIAVMGNLNPTLRDSEDFKHKLWDHLFIMSDFQLDVDSPYPQPSRQDLTLVPQKLPYPQSRVVFKHYGKYVQRFVEMLSNNSESPRSAHEIVNIARYMRTKSYEYNNEHPNNGAIVRDIHIMAGGSYGTELSEVAHMRSEYRGHVQRNFKRANKQSHNGRKQMRNVKGQQRHNAHKA